MPNDSPRNSEVMATRNNGLLDGKVALITGASAGIGKVAASLFAEEGATVIIADIDEASGEATAADIRNQGGSTQFLRTDVTDSESVKSAVDTAARRFGALDVIYNNVGGTGVCDGPITDVSDEEFWRAIRLNLHGTWLPCKWGIPELVRGGGGVVINSSSRVAFMGTPQTAAYTAAKGAVTALTRSMAAAYGKHNIRVNALAASVTKTDRLLKRLADGAVAPSMAERHRLGLLEPIQVAKAALFLASDLSSGMTGHILMVDSGVTVT